MKLKVLYFASIREKVGRDAEEIDVPGGISSVAGLRGHLQARGGAWAEALAETKLLRMAVNQDVAKGTAPIKAGDEIAFFPPVTGG